MYQVLSKRFFSESTISSVEPAERTVPFATTHHHSSFRCQMLSQLLALLVTLLEIMILKLKSSLVGVDTNCGAEYAAVGADGGGYDHVIIPGGQCAPATGGTTNLLNDKYCGTQLNCLTAAPAVTTAATAGTVCSNQRPFKISVKSDDREYHNPTALSESVAPNNAGFALSYYMQTSCLDRPGG